MDECRRWYRSRERLVLARAMGGARVERSDIAPFRRDPHSVAREQAGSGRIRQSGAEGTRSGALRCNSIAFGILTKRNGREQKNTTIQLVRNSRNLCADRSQHFEAARTSRTCSALNASFGG